ncbi:MAG: hypothetical protein JJU33_07180 [Phycisphaerales bacterium]|nr:hypothetical protein [Phycisphaerales bacterium]
MSRGKKTNNIMAGLFLFGSLVAAVVVSAIISGIDFESRSDYTVRFSLADGAAGLRPGSPVTLGGQRIGSVTSVDFYREPTSRRPGAVEIGIRILDDIPLFDDSVVVMERPLFGANSVVDFVSAGGGPGSERLDEGGIIRGTLAPPAFLAQAGFGAEQRNALRDILDGLTETVQRTNELLDRVAPEVDPAVAEVRETITAARDTATALRDRMERWGGTTERVLARVEETSDRLPGLVDRTDDLIDTTKLAVDESRETIERVRDTVDENRPRVDRIFEHAESIMRGVDEEGVPAFLALVEKGTEELGRAGDTIARVDGALAEELPGLRRAMANARLASEQLRLTTVEVRAQPWRLLIRPTTKELERQLMYDSARSYASAVSDLRAASESLEAALAAGAGDDTERMRRLGERLESAFESYEQAERDLLDQFVKGR